MIHLKTKNRITKLIVLIVFVFTFVNTVFADVYYIPNNNQYYSNYYPYNPYYPTYPNGTGFNPYVNPYGNPYGYYAYSREGSFIIPYDSYYYMIGYDRQVYVQAYGEVMQSRVPVLAGNYEYPTYIANRLIYSAYVSISTWCNDNIMSKEGVQDYYLNNASVANVTPTQVVLMVDCALKKKGIISGYEQFRVTIDVQNGKFVWRNVGTNGHWLYGDGRVYEFDSNNGNVIIIQ